RGGGHAGRERRAVLRRERSRRRQPRVLRDARRAQSRRTRVPAAHERGGTMTRGAFVTLEGGEGVGKSTNMALVAEVLGAHGLEVVTTREPGGTDLGEQIRQWVLHGEHGPLGAVTETLLMLAARSEHLDRVIRPALAAGRWVVC